jgi:hypothetical protein
LFWRPAILSADRKTVEDLKRVFENPVAIQKRQKTAAVQNEKRLSVARKSS